MKMCELPVMEKFIRVCEDGWNLGWHERNGGNLTYLLDREETAAMEPFFSETPGQWKDLGVCDTALAGRFFIATGSGKFFRNVSLDPEDSLCVLEINDKGDSYRIRWGLVNGGRPTSEFPTHYMNHCVRYKATNGTNRVIYHAHTPNMIAMTNILPLKDRDITRALWQSATECPVVFPGGVGVVPWMVPGGSDIALATCEKMKEFDAAVWAQHGTFVSGPDFDIAFGLMHTIEKAAQIWILSHSTGLPYLQTIEDDGMRAIAKEFGVTIREDFLD